MKEGYVVMDTYYGEIYGVYKSEKAAERHLRKVVRYQYGSCPRDLSKLWELGGTIGTKWEGVADLQVVHFEENLGEGGEKQ